MRGLGDHLAGAFRRRWPVKLATRAGAAGFFDLTQYGERPDRDMSLDA
jgi:hypothetical protein